MVYTCFDTFLQALTHSNCLLKGLCSLRTSTTSTSTQASTVLQKSCGNNSSIQRSMRQNCISWRWRLWSQTNHWVFLGLRILTSLSHTDTALPWHAAGWYSLIFVDYYNQYYMLSRSVRSVPFCSQVVSTLSQPLTPGAARRGRWALSALHGLRYSLCAVEFQASTSVTFGICWNRSPSRKYLGNFKGILGNLKVFFLKEF